MASIGIDCGSAACKAVLLYNDAIETFLAPTGWNPKETAAIALQTLLSRAGLSRGEVVVVATGYGRVGIDFADKSITEITCHAMGAQKLLPGVSTVIDIGGQDSKAISIKNGKVESFQMNDKCAAGTGRFLEMTAMRLGVDNRELETLLEKGESCTISSMCAVFADSEIVSLLAAGHSREAVAGGVVESVATRAAGLCGKIQVRPPVLLTGGLSGLEKLREALAKRLGCPVETSRYAQFTGAIGAAMLGERRQGSVTQ